MTYDEALRLFGLDEDATEADIKLAYKEMAQILHPDKYADNKRLSERANEQFKLVNEARDILLGKKGAARGGAGKGAGRSRGGGQGYSYGESDRASSLKARLAGIAAARTQLTAQLDTERDRRRVGIYLTVGGIIGVIVGFKIRMLEAVGAPALIWGVIQLFSTQANIKMLQEHLDTLEKQRKKCEKALGKL
ncbi:MAG: J domain-containing protein [Coriobacteriia bacterium]|nr:J domain-containing protein [Coriobacteriia bacterium]